jgi:hypothetical protein
MDNPTPRPYDCEQCGQVHVRCLGHNTEGGPCGRQAIDGSDVCPTHGARAPQVAAAAARRVETARAERAVATYGLSIAIDPFDAIMEEIARTYGHVKWLGEIIATMEVKDLVWGKTLEEAGKGTGQKEGNTAKVRSEANINIWLALYKDERKHLVDVSKAAIQCGIAEREIRLLERQGQMMADFVRGFIDDPGLGFDQAMRQRAREIASQHLRMLTAA